MDTQKFASLCGAVKDYNPSKEEARALFERAEVKRKDYQSRVKASIPSKEDRQRVYNL